MNTVNITGRITHDLELKVTTNNKHIMDFQIAVRKNKDESDFFKCQAWNQSADYLNDYAVKGSMVGITGQLRTYRFETKDGRKAEKTYVLVDRIEILDRKKESLDQQNGQYQSKESFSPNVDLSPEDLPFY